MILIPYIKFAVLEHEGIANKEDEPLSLDGENIILKYY